MKIVERNILPFQEQFFFAPVRDKIDYIRILVYATRQLLLNSDTSGTKVGAKMKLIIDKMSRLFLYKDKKYFSVSFPFVVEVEDFEVINLATYSGTQIDYQIISAVLSIIESEHFKRNPSLIDFFNEPEGIEYLGLQLLEEIYQFEPSYIRYDNDPEKENGKLHPINHLDINYSQYSTFKLGLQNEITTDYFENLQNIKTDCSFIID